MKSGFNLFFMCFIFLGALAPAHAFSDDGLEPSLTPHLYGLYLRDSVSDKNVGEKIDTFWLRTDENWLFVGTWETARGVFGTGTHDLYLYYPKLGGSSLYRNPRIVTRQKHDRMQRSSHVSRDDYDVELVEKQYDCLDASVVRRYFFLEISNGTITSKFDFIKENDDFYKDSYRAALTGFMKEVGAWNRTDSEHQALWEIVCNPDNYDLGPKPSRRIR